MIFINVREVATIDHKYTMNPIALGKKGGGGDKQTNEQKSNKQIYYIKCSGSFILKLPLFSVWKAETTFAYLNGEKRLTYVFTYFILTQSNTKNSIYCHPM